MQIIDTFTFFNELTILDLRLNMLDKHVDKFVLVEATKSHQNKPKPLYYQDNKHLFEKFNHKIEHIIIDDFPQHTYWSHDAFQRNCITRGLLGKCNDNDIVFVSDVDEVWDPSRIDLNSINDQSIYMWQSAICYFYFNLIAQPNAWIQPFYLKYKLLEKYINTGFKLTEDLMRNTENRFFGEKITLPDLRGWHFSYTEDWEHKLQNFTHSEHSNKTTNYIHDCIKNMQNPFHPHIKMHLVKDTIINEYLPSYVVDNIEKYQKFIP